MLPRTGSFQAGAGAAFVISQKNAQSKGHQQARQGSSTIIIHHARKGDDRRDARFRHHRLAAFDVAVRCVGIKPEAVRSFANNPVPGTTDAELAATFSVAQ